MSHDAVVLAGGRGSRLGGVAKAEVRVGGRAMLDHVLDACAGARRVVVVGPPALARPGVVLVREDPPGGGPVAGLDAGLRALAAAAGAGHPDRSTGDRDDVTADLPVLVLGCDVPRAGGAVADLLAALAGDPGADVALLVDTDGRPQPLVAAYRPAALRRALTDVGPLTGVPLRRVLDRLRAVPVADPAGHGRDADTWDDVAGLEHLLVDDAAAPGPAADPAAATPTHPEETP